FQRQVRRGCKTPGRRACDQPSSRTGNLLLPENRMTLVSVQGHSVCGGGRLKAQPQKHEVSLRTLQSQSRTGVPACLEEMFARTRRINVRTCEQASSLRKRTLCRC